MSESKNNPELINVFFPSIIDEGEEFKDWPYHITLMPWYQTSVKKAERIAEQTARLAVPFRVKLGDRLMFGLNHDVPVYDVVPKALISAIHELTLEAMHKEGTAPTCERTSGKNYHPHMTIQPSQPELKDHVFLVNNITVIKKLNHGFRQVVHVAKIHD